ncbi:hypothetical protein CKM354_001045800 [Cercospora kikuchii]|uniref:Uncharacterized protein n=1 Tax=Cercospora kikuchii TaxID=84275 RepID=A0A9P3CWZ0_9PEZI|nr:uncharacterized protein CKM354_001045800 [Cercospora kikuchii]GIZ47365.1 hypothetical protein CKM354_001045800 [Cercospora kikuchii]
MSAEPSPTRVARLCHLVNDTDAQELVQQKIVVDPRAYGRNGPPPGDTLQRARKETMELMNSYHKLQEALLDFRGGFCIMCHLPPEKRHLQTRHAHGCQGTAVCGIKDIPGLLVYPELLQEKSVLVKLIDELLLSPDCDFLADELEPSELDRHGRLLPRNVASLLGSVLDLGTGKAALQISTPGTVAALDSPLQNNERMLQIPLGCDAVLVVALQPDDIDSLPAEHTAEIEDPVKLGFERGTVGILVRPGDVIAFSGPAQRAWKGIVKIIPGTWQEWENEWPCWGDRTTETDLEAQKGCMKGCAFDLKIS